MHAHSKHLISLVDHARQRVENEEVEVVKELFEVRDGEAALLLGVVEIIDRISLIARAITAQENH